MINSDRLQEIRERVQLTRETYPNNGTILLLGSDLDGLLQLVTEQQREIDRLKNPRKLKIESEQNPLEVLERTIEAKGYRKQERPM